MPSVNKHSITSLKPAAIALLAFSLFTASPVLAQGDTLAYFTPTLSDSFKQLMRDARVEDGEEIFMRKCSSCHDHEKDGGHGKGPHLWNVLGRKAGSAPGFDYSDAMKNIGHTWNLATINYYLTRTDRAVPGRAMDFRGIRRDKVRAKLLRFLMTINDNPPALP
jgi:cytochrome c